MGLFQNPLDSEATTKKKKAYVHPSRRQVWPYKSPMLQKSERKEDELSLSKLSQALCGRDRGEGTGCKTDHGEKRVGHGEVTRYKSRVFPFCLALFVRATCRI